MVDQPRERIKEVSPRDVALKMKLDYSRGIRDQTTKYLEGVSELLWMLEKPNLDIDAFTLQTAELISKLFSIESVAIGVRDHDHLYRYKAVVGLEKDVVDGFKKLAYREDELFNPKNYPSYEISRHTKLFLAEDHPYADGEEFTYRRPGLIGMKRFSLIDSLEADYIDVLFYGQNKEILGFIELSGTRLRKLPDTATIKWVELIGGILGVAMHREKPAS